MNVSSITTWISVAIQLLTLFGFIFGVYLYFRKPQEKSEMNDAIFAEQFRHLSETFTTKFQDMKEGVVKVMQNDMQELKADVREHVKNQIINEREVASKLAALDTKLEILIKK